MHLSPGAVVFLAALLVLPAGCGMVEPALARAWPRAGTDLNTADVEKIDDLPGVSADDAERIVRHRPYDSKDELVRRGVVAPDALARFTARVYLSEPPGTSGATASE